MHICKSFDDSSIEFVFVSMKFTYALIYTEMYFSHSVLCF